MSSKASTKRSGVQVTEVRIAQFRSLIDVVVELDDLTVLVGANNAGKTSFLDGLYAALGAGRKTLSVDDVHIDAKEATPPVDRSVVIDVCIRPVGEDGSLLPRFPEGSYWVALWGTGIQQDLDFHDFMAFRTTYALNAGKGDYTLERKFLKEWKPANEWQSGEASAESVTADQIEPIALHYIDAKRDLEEDLRRQGSFWRRLTDNLGLDAADVAAFEKALSDLNTEIISKSDVLKHLRTNLSDMTSVVSADSAGVEITPVARRLRDLSKGVDVTFATTGAQAFPLARHGMGTRSLASLLVFRAFVSWRYQLAEKQGDQTHSLLALEEPESHLHPQAQRAMFGQIKVIPGQRIVSTHSPYFAGQAKLAELRLFSKHAGITQVSRLDLSKLTIDDLRKLERQVIASRGDLLFARAVILFEGETEEQALPLWAQAYWGANVHELGFSFVSVGGGANYFPFVWLARSFGIRWYIFSDGEDKPVNRMKADVARAGVADISKESNIVVVPNKSDFEGYLMHQGYQDAFESAIAACAGAGTLDAYIKNLHGKAGKKIDGLETMRDYTGAEGRRRAALDMVRERKTRYAVPLAMAILALAKVERRVPPLMKTLMDEIGETFSLKALSPDKVGLE